MSTPELDREAVEQLAIALMIPMRNHLLRGPYGAYRVQEVLNALAGTVALVILGADGEGGEAEQFFYTALRNQLAAGLQ